LLQLPALSAKDYARLARGDDGPLPQEHWDRPPMRAFPHAFTALAWMRGKRLGAELHDEEPIRALYDFKHPSWVSSLTLALMERFAITARERGHKPLVAIIPDEGSLRALQEGRGLPYAAFEKELRKGKVEVIAIAERLIAAGPIDALYTRDGRLSALGHAAVGALVAAAIDETRKTAP
jgi:hypothetical protein